MGYEKARKLDFSFGAPDLCGWSWSSPGKPSPRWHPGTFPASDPETNGLSSPANKLTNSRSPCIRTPDTWGSVGCTRRTAARAYSETTSCWSTPHTHTRTRTHTHAHSSDDYFNGTPKSSKGYTYIITFASSLKSSSVMQSSLTIFTATFLSFHFPSNTSPNWPLPISWPRFSSSGSISHWSVEITKQVMKNCTNDAVHIRNA